MKQEKNGKKINYKIIKSAASTLFLNKGYGNTSMNDIADALNIKKASLYHHIQSRTQLVYDIVNELETHLLDQFTQLKSLPCAKEQKKIFIQAVKNFYFDTDNCYLIIKLAHEVSAEPMNQLANNFIQQWVQQLKQLLAQHTEKMPAQQKATETINLLIGNLINHKLSGKKPSATKFVKYLEQLLAA